MLKGLFSNYFLATGTELDIGTMLESVQSSLMSAINQALPIAGVVFASIAGLMIGIKIFKRLTGART